MDKIKTLLVDDHAVVRKGLASLLGTCPEIAIVADTGDGEEGVKLALKLRPDVVVMDLQMPGMGGIEATKRIVSEWPEANVLVLTTFGASTALRQVQDAGARGAVLKSADLETLRRAIAEVAAGKSYLAPDVRQIMANDPPMPSLTPRQRQILLSLTRGLSNADIATMLGISLPMVKEHISELLRRLGVANRTEAVAIAMRNNLQDL